VDSSTVSGLGHKLHGRLEEVDVQPNQIIYPPQTFKPCFRGIPIVPHQAAHHIAILLFDMTAIVLLIGTRPGEGDLLITTVVVEALIDELAAVVRVYAK
jgi:hypothetical protein